MDRRIEKELLPFCENNSITLQAYSPIEQELLTGKIKLDYEVKLEEVRENRKLALEILSKWDDLTEKYNCTLGNLVIR